MHIKERELFLYLKIKGNPKFEVVSDSDVIIADDNIHVFSWNMGNSEIKKIKVKMINCRANEAIIVDKIILDEVKLTHLDQYGVYQLDSGGTKKTYGYMDEPGTYTFKIRCNALSHHYITYLLQ